MYNSHQLVQVCLIDDGKNPTNSFVGVCQQNFIGTVMGVDDTASIMVAWDNGSGLNVVYGEDSCRKLDSVKVTCYGSTETWDSRKDAMEFYLRAMAASEGSEQSRYTKVYTELAMGLPDCTDEE